MRMLREAFARSAALALFATLAACLSGAASTGSVAVLNRALAGEAGPRIGLLFGLVCALALASRVIAELGLLRLSQRLVRELRETLSQKLLAQPLERLEALGKPQLLAMLTDDVATYGRSAEAVPLLLMNGMILIGCFAYLIWLSPALFGLLALLLGAAVAAFSLTERRAVAALARVRELKDRLYARVRNLVEGTKELQQNSSKADAFFAALHADASASERHYLRGMRDYTLSASVGMLGFYATIGALLFAAPQLTATSTVLAQFCVTLLYLMQPLVDVLGAIPLLRQSDLAFDRLRALEQDLSRAEPPQAQLTHGASAALHIELRGITHRRERDHEGAFVLGPVDLSVRAGELVFLVGGNGSGKTTLALILLGLYTPEAGSITCNGEPVSAAQRAAYRQLFSAVFADFHLFEHWPLLADPERARRAQRYLELLDLQHKVELRADGLSTLALSTGQRKRLALLSAYLEDRPVYVFDEWAADQDPAFRRIFYTQLLPELRARGKAVVAITHDDAYFHLADRVVKLAEGRLVRGESPRSHVQVQLAT